MIGARTLFKVSISNYANDRRYRRAQSAYLVLLLLVVVAMWPEPTGPGEDGTFALVVFLTRWLIPLAFPLMQARLGYGLGDRSDGESAGRMSVAALTGAETLHCLAQWALQAPIVIAAVTAAGFTQPETIAYLLRLLLLGLAGRMGGLIIRGLVRAAATVTQPDGSEKRYERSSRTLSR
jgi:RsiW-degrading membrane proteinase PrsW (M82 family)